MIENIQNMYYYNDYGSFQFGGHSLATFREILMSFLLRVWLVFSLVFLVSCAQNEDLSERLLERVANFHKKRTDITISPANLESFAMEQRQFDVAWLYERTGSDVASFQSKITGDSFSRDELYKLLKRAYIPHDDEFRYVHKRAAIHALSNSIYRHMAENLYDPDYHETRNILYAPEFVEIMVKESPKVVGDIPSNISNYYQLIFKSFQQNIKTFDYVPMQFKTDPKVLNYIFYKMDSRYSHPNQKVAVQYATYEQAKEYLSRNGLLLEFVRSDFQDNSELVYTAILQNEMAEVYASPRLRRIIETSGPEKLIGFSARVYLVRDRFSQGVSDLWYVVKVHSKTYSRKISEGTVSMVNKLRSLLFNEDLEEDFVDEIAELEEAEETRTLLPFIEDDAIMTDPKLIIQIQDLHKRNLRNLWRIAKIDRQREIYIAYYQPQGRRYLASIIYRNGDEFVVSDYKATLTTDGSTIWRFKDRGRFSPKQIQVIDIEEVKTKEIRVKIKWKGDVRSSMYLLVEKNGKFVKQFLSHVEEL